MGHFCKWILFPTTKLITDRNALIRNVEEASEGLDAPLRDLEARAHRSRPLSDRGHHRFAITPRSRLCGVNCQYYSALKERKMSMRRFIKIGMDAKHILIVKIMNRGSMGSV